MYRKTILHIIKHITNKYKFLGIRVEHQRQNCLKKSTKLAAFDRHRLGPYPIFWTPFGTCSLSQYSIGRKCLTRNEKKNPETDPKPVQCKNRKNWDNKGLDNLEDKNF